MEPETGRPVRSYRDVNSAPIATLPILREPAEAALAVLARHGERTVCPEHAHRWVWHARLQPPSTAPISIILDGTDLPATIPDQVIHPGDIGKDPKWVGTHRLIVRAPIIVLDFAWRNSEPLRIMTFANGDWQHDLRSMAQS